MESSSAEGSDSSENPSKLQVLPQTRIREAIAPLLPPPVVRAWTESLDPQLEPYLGPEPTVTLVGTVFAAWITTQILKWVLFRALGSGGRAYRDDDDSNKTKGGARQSFDASVLFVGPPGGGKTRWFYQMCFEEADLPTVQSIKANVGVRPAYTRGETPIAAIRYMDWPGHASVSRDDEILLPILQQTSSCRVILVLDATKPIPAAADTLFQLLQCYHDIHQSSRKSQKSTILVAVNKSDRPKAKNAMRVKLQMRSELERLLKSQGDEEPVEWWPAGEPLDWDKLFVRVEFLATSAAKPTAAITNYCETGTFSDG